MTRSEVKHVICKMARRWSDKRVMIGAWVHLGGSGQSLDIWFGSKKFTATNHDQPPLSVRYEDIESTTEFINTLWLSTKEHDYVMRFG